MLNRTLSLIVGTPLRAIATGAITLAAIGAVIGWPWLVAALSVAVIIGALDWWFMWGRL